ncbi:MAG: phospholipase D-like domain-containing protein [Haemophilus parainfluenzae]
MVFYIWSNDGMINEVKQALEEAVQRGVKVCLYSIPLAVMLFESPVCKEMREKGIEITEALHVNLFRMFFSRIDLRQHRKIIIIDNQIAYTGSMNMVDPNFFKQDSNVGNWIDDGANQRSCFTDFKQLTCLGLGN